MRSLMYSIFVTICVFCMGWAILDTMERLNNHRQFELSMHQCRLEENEKYREHAVRGVLYHRRNCMSFAYIKVYGDKLSELTLDN